MLFKSAAKMNDAPASSTLPSREKHDDETEDLLRTSSWVCNTIDFERPFPGDMVIFPPALPTPFEGPTSSKQVSRNPQEENSEHVGKV